jgi:regulator of chromosome condensation
VAKATTKKAPAKKMPAPPKQTAKRKLEEDTDAPKPNESKRRKAISEAPPARPLKALKTAKVETPLTTTPTQRLDIYAFGGNSAAELGLGPDHRSGTVRKPVLNEYLKAATVGVVQVAAGGIHCVALTFDSKILTWGGNDHSALGRDTNWDGGLVDMDADDSDSDDSDGQLNPKEATPTEIDTTEIPEGTIFTQVAAGDNASFAVTDIGLVYGWGTFRVGSSLHFKEVDTNPYISRPAMESLVSHPPKKSRNAPHLFLVCKR